MPDIKISESVWSAAEQAAAEDDEWWLRLHLVPDTPPKGPILEALDRALDDVVEAYSHEGADRPDRALALVGEWDWVSVRDGALLQVRECEEFRWVLETLVTGLQRRGVSGTLDLWDRIPGPALPHRSHCLILRLRPAGVRHHGGHNGYEWTVDPEAQASLVSAAVEWCLAGEGQRLALEFGTLGPLSVSAGDPVASTLIEQVRRSYTSTFLAEGDNGFRAVGVRPPGGAVSLVVGGAVVENDGWRSLLADFRAMLLRHADAAVYGYVRRGWLSREALERDGLADDWPVRPDDTPVGAGYTDRAFEDLWAPDAFGLQLLGSGYSDRDVASERWYVNPAASGARVLEYVDPKAWFSTPFVAFGELQPPEERVPPPVLVRARTELASLLYAPGRLPSR